MAGMNGFTHNCESEKVKYADFKKTLKQSSFSDEQVSIIWDFYVAHAFAGESGQEITLEDYGWVFEKSREKTLSTIETSLLASAGIDKMCCVRATTIKDTLLACDLSNSELCVDHPRIVLLQKYSVTVDENENLKFAGGGENRINCLFRHMRNAFAHANTFFFENGNVLLEDKDGGKITARILIRQQTLLDWIALIDKDQKYYVLKDVSKNPEEDKVDGTPNS